MIFSQHELINQDCLSSTFIVFYSIISVVFIILFVGRSLFILLLLPLLYIPFPTTWESQVVIINCALQQLTNIHVSVFGRRWSLLLSVVWVQFQGDLRLVIYRSGNSYLHAADLLLKKFFYFFNTSLSVTYQFLLCIKYLSRFVIKLPPESEWINVCVRRDWLT